MSRIDDTGGRGRPSEELLNSFVDDQLAPEEKGRLFVEIAQDEGLSRQACELRKLHDLVQFAYRNPPRPVEDGSSGSRRTSRSIAMGMALIAGLAAGWFIHLGTSPSVIPEVASASASEPLKVLMHINDSDSVNLAQSLDEVESLMAEFNRTGQNARVEVIINGDGLVLVREDVTLFADRIAHLQKTHDNLTFMACQNTIDRLKNDSGIVAKLLPGVTVIDSGVAQLMRRQQQGWAYIQG